MANNIRSGLTRSVLPQLSSPRPNPNARTPQQALQEMTRIMGSATQKYLPLSSQNMFTVEDVVATGTYAVAPSTSTGWIMSRIKGLLADCTLAKVQLQRTGMVGTPMYGFAVGEYSFEDGNLVCREVFRGRPDSSGTLTIPNGLQLSASKAYCAAIHVACDAGSSVNLITAPRGYVMRKAAAAFDDGIAFSWNGFGGGPADINTTINPFPLYFALSGDVGGSIAVQVSSLWY